jgi:HK97 family phage portal protein
MFDWLSKAYHRITGKAYDTRDLLGVVDTSLGYVDIWRKQPRPNRYALALQHKNVAYCCSNLNAQACLKTPLRVYQKKYNGDKSRFPAKTLSGIETKQLTTRNKLRLADEQRIDELAAHPLLELLDRPNPYMDTAALLEFTQLFMEIVGSCYWYCMKNDWGVPVELYLLLPQYVRPVWDHIGGKILYYDYAVPGKRITYQPDEIVPFLMPNITNPLLDGYSPLMAVFESVNIENKLAGTTASILDNSGRPDAVLIPKDGIGAEEASRWEQRFNARFRRSGNGGVLVAEEDAQLVPLQFSPRDMSWMAMHETTKEAICNAYGVPPQMLSADGSTQYNVDVTIRQRHVEDAVTPRLRRNQSIINRYLVPLFDGSGDLFCAFDDPSPTNREIERQDLQLLSVNGAMTKNELRQKYGYEPVEEFDAPTGQSFSVGSGKVEEEKPAEVEREEEEKPVEAEETEQSLQTNPALTLNGAQIASATAIVQAVAAGQVPRDSGIGQLMVLLNLTGEQAGQVMGSVGLEKPAAAPSGPAEAPPKPAKCDCGHEHKAHEGRKGHDKELPKGEELVKVLRKFFKSQREQVIASLNRTKSDDGRLPSKFQPLKKWDRELYTEAQPLVQLEFRKEYEKNAHELKARTGVSDEKFNVTSPKLKEKCEHLALHFCQETNNSTTMELNAALTQLRKDIEEGLVEEGDRMSDLTKRVEAVFDRADKERVELIAQTESSRAHHEGLRQSAKDSGVVKGFKLLPSSAACEKCLELADTEIGLDEFFAHDEQAPAEYQDRFVPVHPACECAVEQVLTEEEPKE